MSFDLVFFGGAGDLTWRKLRPALFQAFRHGKLPSGGRILSVARDEQTDEQHAEDYSGLAQWISERNAATAVLYLATSPHLFTQICEQPGAVGLNKPDVRVGCARRVRLGTGAMSANR